ncbi:MAG: EAL domain-containing protein [Aquimonas sp.]|nr:EAL domain-containing protein [Aquimonas sp.]
MGLIDAFALSESVAALLSAESGCFLAVNPAFERVLGHRAEDVVGRMPLEIDLWPDLSTRASIWASLREHRRVSNLAVSVRHADGRVLSCCVQCELVDVAGKVQVFSLLQVLGEGRTDDGCVEPPRESYRSLYWHAAEGLYRSLPGAGLIDVNPAMARMFGFDSPAEMLLACREDVSALYASPADAEAVREELAAAGRVRERRLRMRRRDGQLIWASENARTVRDALGRSLFFEGSLVDISAQQQAESALRESEALYRSLVHNCRDGVFLIQRGRMLFVNEALAESLGYAPADLIGSPYMSLVAEEDAAAQADRRKAREDGSLDVQRYRIRVLHRDGGKRVFEVHADAIEYQGDIASTGIMRDVTQDDQQQSALLQAEARYRELFEGSPVGLFRSTETGRMLEANAALARMLRYATSVDLVQGVDSVERLYADPGDRERLLAELSGCGEVRDFATRLIGADGSLVWASLSVSRGAMSEQGYELVGSAMDISRQREAEHLLRFHANYDPLTGLPNRWQFEQKLLLVLGEAQASGRTDYAVLFLDLDGFKWVNDSLGHGAGDRLLVAIGERLSLQVGRQCLLARYGGDEFGLLPSGPCSREQALRLAGEVARLFERPFVVDGTEVFSAASIGIVLGRPDYRWPEQVLRDADTAMYQAKGAGKARFVVFDEAMHAEAQRRFELQTDLRLALERCEFELHFQPVVNLADGGLLGCEALVRWRHPRRGLLLPGEFLGLAEETGLIGDIDLWVLHTACAQLGRWRLSSPQLWMSLNMDERLVASGTVAGHVRQALQRSRIPASALHVEITERVFRASQSASVERLQSLKATGVSLVVDDFGTGYSSLESFASSPFDALKIDQGFVRDMLVNPRHRAIVRTIVGFAGDLGLHLTAEGVETEAQREALLHIGCRQGQGWLFARALPAAEFEAWLDARPSPGGRRERGELRS